VCDACQLVERPIQHRPGDVAASFLDVREVEGSRDHKCGHRYLTQPGEGQRGVKVPSDWRRPERDGVHVTEQAAGLTSDAPLWRQRTVQPEAGLDGFHLVQVAGRLCLRLLGHQILDPGRISRRGRPAHGRRDEDEGVDSGWMLKPASIAILPPPEHPTKIEGLPFAVALTTAIRSATAEKSSVSARVSPQPLRS